MNSRLLARAGALALVATVAGCATWSEMPRTEKGTAVGATGGALVGAAVGGPVGAVVGAGVGGYTGHYEAQNVGRNGAAARVSDDNVRAAQRALADRGYNPGAVDGVMGPGTEQALRDFQQRQGLAVTGQLDSTTARELGVARY